MRAVRHLVLAAFATLVATQAMAAPANIAAAIAAPDRPAAARTQDAARMPAEVLGFLGLKSGDRALDVMAGNGYYAEVIGRAVGPKGAVIALEPPSFLDDKGRASWADLIRRTPNVRLQAQMPTETALAPASLDFTLMHLVYHDLYWESVQYKFPRTDPAAFLAKLFAATRPGGIVGVVDHVAEPGGDPRVVADKLHRIDPAVIKADFAAAGFVLEAESGILRQPADDHSLLVFSPAVRGKTDRVLYRFRKPASCNSVAAAGFAGRRFDTGTAEAARKAAGAGTVRPIRPGQPVTMDFRTDRLNIELSADGRITGVRCG